MLGRSGSLNQTRDSNRTRGNFTVGMVTFRERRGTGSRPMMAWIIPSRMGYITNSTIVQWMTSMMLGTNDIHSILIPYTFYIAP